MQKLRRLRPTSWLAEVLDLSISTIEKLRAQGSDDLPPYLVIGGSIRYSDLDVEAWIESRLQSGKATPAAEQPTITLTTTPSAQENDHKEAPHA